MNTCTYCKKQPPRPNRKKCEQCTLKVRESNKRYINKKKTEGICPRCGVNPLPTGRGRCMSCNDKHYTEIKALRERRTSCGMCAECGLLQPSGKAMSCEECILKAIAKAHFKDVTKWTILKELYDKNHTCPYTRIDLTLGLNASLDHKIPKSKGGDNSLDNLQFIHFWCNMMKMDMDEAEFIVSFREFVEISRAHIR